MNLKDFKAISHDKDSYTIQHPSGKLLRVEKSGLHRGAHSAIQHLFRGGQSYDSGGITPEMSQRVSDLGGGDPMAAFKQPAANAPVAAPAAATPPASANSDYAEFAPDLTAEDAKDLDAPTGGGVYTDKANRAARAADKAKVDAVKAIEGPVQGDADFQGPENGPAIDQALNRAQVAMAMRSPDSSGGDPLAQEKTGMQGLLGEQIQHQEEGLAASQAAGQKVADVQAQEAQKLEALPSYNDIVAGYQAKDQKLAQAYSDAQIDPQHFYHSMGTGSKILTGIGMVLSGMGSATTGQPSYAMSVINDAVKRDMEAQQNDQSKKMNLWKMNREAMGNDTAANLSTENQIKASALAKLQSAQTSAMLPVEKLRAQQAIDQLKQEMLQNNMRLGLLTGGQQAARGAGGPALNQYDPATLVPEMVKDPAQQKQVYEEIRNRQNIAKNGNAMLAAFDRAASEVSGVGGVLHSTLEKTPGQLQLEQLMMPNMSELDGTIRKSAVDTAHDTIIPGAMDFGRADRLASKRQSLVNWMKSQQAAPTAKGNYIDLDRFQSTAMPNAASAAAPAAGSKPMATAQTQIMHGHTYQKVPGGWKLVK